MHPRKQGDHKIEIIADANNDILEETENNNQRVYWTNVPNQKPKANFNWTPGEPIVNESNIRVYSTATDPDKDSLTYHWEYSSPNGETGTFGTSKEFRNLFKKIGDWEVTLQVEDEFGGTDSISKTITVYQKNTLSAHIYHTEEWSKERNISRDNPNFKTGESFVVKAKTTDAAKNVTIIPPANLSVKTGLKGNDNNTAWYAKLLPKEDVGKVPKGPYPWIIRATFEDGQIIQKPLLIEVTGKVYPNIHLTQ